MEWRDEGLVIGVRRHGESAVILELMTRAHGRHMGLVRGGSGRALRSVLQVGNSVEVLWRARLEEHLGAFAVEPLRSRAARLIDRAFALHGVAHLAALLRLLPERDAQRELFEMAELIADRLDSLDLAPALMARFELALLQALGFGLDVERCALTGATQDLAFVSPKTGRAVTRDAGAPWRDRLLPFPPFLQDCARAPADASELAAAFRLTGHFLARDVFTPRGLEAPQARALYVGAAARG
ncbi:MULTISPECIES: DNA repair protein RecO [Methylosinus]|uniref:DNA repair protein RecO n=1 Tax=Methylosinus trichosporium (strain ATCC 35070 / NCIMB 11131 / UNIQEM 75 / OB3b) TaxID=595536 RepID=A0A2D2D312_METT3|nr:MULTISPECIES: DNA repair protein RecO [Methylosinus]ATQ69388.1 DNA repair protein RecO [Methylosinus trichosporium OB3b]OBS52901.1 DNA repair protein RecO [Methylosinus sp. 3S-1]